mmetsp:Transcript_33537/g.66484  ORF Transcript_33537/g.66484 Transcript_33537/m.66484 type:complete len:84 (+) Transcript_33537:433-684(+)
MHISSLSVSVLCVLVRFSSPPSLDGKERACRKKSEAEINADTTQGLGRVPFFRTFPPSLPLRFGPHLTVLVVSSSSCLLTFPD